ncbi:alanine racemase [Sinobaca qinghaiensis]|uniref:Alanine racemase n=1 Tax=Sinobaca qinghaiensis TaxID=342944 RepID=A0A419V3Z1_9BACL|nr:alanine racemase [Sinobaca qinghaiensis]RKD73210.1 alanine racemase [Sinobaca qinghaiensis]
MAFQEHSYRDTWVEVDLGNITRNVEQVIRSTGQQLDVMAVVKADGYGHGAVRAAAAAVQGGAVFLGTALLEEAIELREAGFDLPILVLGRTRPEDAETAREYNISLTVFQKEWLEEAAACMAPGQALSVHLKTDTGMGRIGLRSDEEIIDFLETVSSQPAFDLEGIFTHFATADEQETSYFYRQHERFKEIVELTGKIVQLPPYIHCGNSAAGMRFPDRCFTMFRFGISMYGLTPSAEINEELPFALQPAFSLYSRLVQVKKISPGESISYGATYTAEKEEYIGTVPIGYADGWNRHHSTNGGYVLINGEKAPIVGRVCMDQMMVRLSGPEETGTKVTLIGKDNGTEITVLDAAERLGTITYEIPCMISKRVPRKYISSRN